MTTTSYNIYQQITSVRVSTTANLTSIYFNGALNNGVGATLTSLSVGSLVIDGVTLEAGDRVLVNNQTSNDHNGIYVVQTPGGLGALWMLERSPDFQSVEQLKVGQYFTVGAGDTLKGSMYVLVEPLPDTIGMSAFSFVNVADMVSPSGPFLLKAANLSDLINRESGFTNLGLGSGEFLIIDESDFIAGLYVLTNPCPNLILVNATTTGNAVRLPPVDEPESFIPSQGPVFFIDQGFQGIDVQDSTGSVISPLEAPGCEQFILTSNAFPQGVWFVRSFASTVNGKSGDVVLTSSLQTIYVSNSGSDGISSDGSVLNPYATLSHALSSINPTADTPYEIILTTGIYNETNLVLKPWVNMQGEKSTLIVSGSVTLDPSWSDSGSLFIQNFNGLSFPSTVTLDFNAVNAPFSLFDFSNNIISSSTIMNIVGQVDDGSIVLIGNNFGFSDQMSYNITNCYGAINAGAAGNISIINTSDTAGGNFSITDMTETGDVTITTSSTSGMTLFHSGSLVGGNALYQSTGPGVLTVFVRGLKYQNVPTLDNGLGGGSVAYSADRLGALPVLLNGATYNPSSIGDAVRANLYFTPTNYTPVAGPMGEWVADSITGNLAGINNAISALPSFGISQLIWVNDQDGDDSNSGSENSPLKSYEAARLLAISRGASAGLPFQIVIVGAQVVSGAFTISPFVNVTSLSTYESTIYFETTIELAPEWGTMGDPYCEIQNLYIFTNTGGSYSITYPSFQSFSNLKFTNCGFNTDSPFTITGSGTSAGGGVERVIFHNCTNDNPNYTLDYTLENVTAFFINNDLSNSSLTHTVSATDSNCDLIINNCQYYSGDIHVVTSSTSTLTTRITATNTDGYNLNIDGNLNNVIVDATSYMFSLTLSGGATLANLTLPTKTDGMTNSSYTPSSYTPTGDTLYGPNTLTGNLKGINNALAEKETLIAYTEVTTLTFVMSANNEYTANNGSLVSLTLPTTSAVGSKIKVNGKGAGGWRIDQQNAGHVIHVGAVSTTVGSGGSLSSATQYATITLVCVTADNVWVAQGGEGTYTPV